jgi:hypothetical protein
VSFSSSVLVAARGSAVRVTDRGIGSANGNRTCREPVQYSSVESKCLTLRRSGSGRSCEHTAKTGDVAARWQRTTPNTDIEAQWLFGQGDVATAVISRNPEGR